MQLLRCTHLYGSRNRSSFLMINKHLVTVPLCMTSSIKGFVLPLSNDLHDK